LDWEREFDCERKEEAMLEALEFLEFIEWFVGAFAGWRFIFSPSFRRKTRARWKQATRLRVVTDIFCGIAGIAFTAFLIYLIVGLFAGWGLAHEAGILDHGAGIALGEY
jgi:hypothetical protein